MTQEQAQSAPAVSVPVAHSKTPARRLFRHLTVDSGNAFVNTDFGEPVKAVFTIPAPGVLRVRIGDTGAGTAATSMLTEFNEVNAELRGQGDTVRISGDGVDAAWGPEGLSFGAYRHPPPVTMFAGSPPGVQESDKTTVWSEAMWLAPDAAIYGGGESFLGPNLRGRKRKLVNSESHGAAGIDLSYLNVPFFWSDSGWGVFFHTAAPMNADLGATVSECGFFEVEGEVLDFFIFNGSPQEIMKSYLKLTGLPAKFPSWALGVWMGRCSFLSSQDIDEVLADLDAADCPVDVFHVDHWLEGDLIHDLTCNWKVDRKRWPEGWTKTLRDRGIRVSLWHNPYIQHRTKLAKELAGKGMLVRDAKGKLAKTNDMTNRFVLDFTNPATVEWWVDQIKRVAEEEGNSAFKPDFAEEVPEHGVFHDGRTGRQLRNEYANLYQAASFRGLSEVFGEDAALFARSGTSGAQRYPCHWVGDTPATWVGLVNAVRVCLSLSLSGFAFVSHDIGGFWSAATTDTMSKAFETLDSSLFTADVEPELYARWTQWGSVTSVMRFHGTGRREPTAYPEPARSAAIEACRLRKKLRPYLQQVAEEASRSGLPMMRPMVLAYSDDRGARDAELQYMLGSDLLVAPILEKGGRRSFYVPAGEWTSAWGGEPVSGPGWVARDFELHDFPAYWREGSSGAVQAR
ncbi:MAG TPA: TIM-barrel domain-containing protein [Actinomycetota bacterium]|nr:TIM-barrel domain-containing protein [Actinomycetota bacterium]